MVEETLAQTRRRFARAMIRLIHPTVPPHPSDVDKFVYALTVFEKEMAARRKQRQTVTRRKR